MSSMFTVSIGNGDVTYVTRVDPVPHSKKREGRVTIETAGSPGSPARFDVSFTIVIKPNDPDLGLRNAFHLSIPVPIEDYASQYHLIETEAAKRIAPMLRDVADQIEALVEESDKKKSPADT